MADVINFQDYLKRNLSDDTQYMIAVHQQSQHSYKEDTMAKEVTIIVCGGRDFNDNNFLMERLDSFRAYIKREFNEEVVKIIHGGARGADSLAASYAFALSQCGYNIEQQEFPAQWHVHGKSAGPKRNQIMLDQNPDYVIGFEGGRGTNHMLSIARAKGTKTFHIRRAL